MTHNYGENNYFYECRTRIWRVNRVTSKQYTLISTGRNRDTKKNNSGFVEI